MIDLGCLPHGHRASLALARAGWLAGSEDELRACLDTELAQMSNIGWVLGNVISDGLHRTDTGRRSQGRGPSSDGTARRFDRADPGVGPPD